MASREEIAVVWLKRDLRLQDNEALFHALRSDYRVLLLYVFEDSLKQDEHYSDRHWNFIKESLTDLNHQLLAVDTQILTVNGEMESVLDRLRECFDITAIYSHQETGLQITFDRDLRIQDYCRTNLVEWYECLNNGVVRRLKNREGWFEFWQEYMYAPVLNSRPQKGQCLSIKETETLGQQFHLESLATPTHGLQPGGPTVGRKYLASFFRQRHQNYMYHISQPEASRTSCSRISPYLAWGNLSIREVFQEAKALKKTSRNKRHLGAFISRLRWQAHFIQKFEMECAMEHRSVNRGYSDLEKEPSAELQRAWERGQTGFPLVDASMRCLNATGYLNFRMRAMLVSFFTHILWQPWQNAAPHLARQFLDFEPGIHFPQIQMQAGETGINNLRIYNPVKNAKDHDAEGVFIRKWVPELASLPLGFVHEPYLMTPLDQEFHQFRLGEDYPHPVVDLQPRRRHASDVLWGMKKDPRVMEESARILQRHTLANRERMLTDDE